MVPITRDTIFGASSSRVTQSGSEDKSPCRISRLTIPTRGTAGDGRQKSEISDSAPAGIAPAGINSLRPRNNDTRDLFLVAFFAAVLVSRRERGSRVGDADAFSSAQHPGGRDSSHLYARGGGGGTGSLARNGMIQSLVVCALLGRLLRVSSTCRRTRVRNVRY